MKLFSRRVHMTGPPAESMGYATGIAAHVTRTTGREVALWSAGMGAPLGTMLFSMRVEGLADFQGLSATLLADPAYHEQLVAGAAYIDGPAEDSLLEPLNAELGADHPPVGAVAVVTSATMAGGSYQNAIAWGLDMAAHATAVTGVPTMFLMSNYGPFGSVGWIAVAEDAAGVDAANAALLGDTDYVTKLDAGGKLFVEGSAHRMLVTRVA